MDKLLTQKELAERWQVTEESIRNWRNEGIIQTAKGVPVIRFTMQHILELEGVKLEQFSPLLKRRMERELEELREENQRLKKIIGNCGYKGQLMKMDKLEPEESEGKRDGRNL